MKIEILCVSHSHLVKFLQFVSQFYICKTHLSYEKNTLQVIFNSLQVTHSERQGIFFLYDLRSAMYLSYKAPNMFSVSVMLKYNQYYNEQAFNFYHKYRVFLNRDFS